MANYRLNFIEFLLKIPEVLSITFQHTINQEISMIFFNMYLLVGRHFFFFKVVGLTYFKVYSAAYNIFNVLQ